MSHFKFLGLLDKQSLKTALLPRIRKVITVDITLFLSTELITLYFSPIFVKMSSEAVQIFIVFQKYLSLFSINDLFQLCISTRLLSVRVNSLICVGKLMDFLDKWQVGKKTKGFCFLLVNENQLNVFAVFCSARIWMQVGKKHLPKM